ncbi:MAG: hypothetical protein R2748_06045 [Bryobacterales bacterium]
MTLTRAALRMVVCVAVGCVPLAAQGGPFPEPEAVIQGFYIPSQQLAALHVIETVIKEKGSPESAETKALLARYGDAMKGLRALSAGRPDFYLEFNDYMQRPSFRTDVLHRYLPQYENAAIEGFSNEEYQAPPEPPDTNLMVAATALLMLAVPRAYLMRGERVGSVASVLRSVGEGRPGAFVLPHELATVKLFRLRLGIDFECGRIEHEEVETVVTKHTYERQSGSGSFPEQTSSFSSVTYHTFTLATPDGRSVRQMFTDNTFPAKVGDVISSIWCGDRMLYAYNHSSPRFEVMHGGVGQTLRMRAGRGLWMATIAVAAVGGAIVTMVLGGDEAWRAFWAVVLVFGFFSAVYIVLLKMLVQIVRRIPFRVLWRPRFKKFMEEQTEALTGFYAAPVARADSSS